MFKLYCIGKFENKCLRYACEPFLILFRLVSLLLYAYYVVLYNFLYRFLYGSFHSFSANYWHSKDDPWVTNASYANAIFSWVTWVSSWFCILFINYLVLFCILVIYQYILDNRNDELRSILTIPRLLW